MFSWKEYQAADAMQEKMDNWRQINLEAFPAFNSS